NVPTVINPDDVIIEVGPTNKIVYISVSLSRDVGDGILIISACGLKFSFDSCPITCAEFIVPDSRLSKSHLLGDIGVDPGIMLHKFVTTALVKAHEYFVTLSNLMKDVA
ncbi:16273_t:CDS:2, partial [Entrophospora sp. SA101]